MASLCVDDLSCSVCRETYKDPVLLSCSHSFCKDCLQQFWKTSGTQNCPLCRRRSSKELPPGFFSPALKNLCESHLKERKERRSSEHEETCSLHDEKLKLFCFEDQETLCLICRDSEKHVGHKIRPITETVSSHKEKLKSALTSLEEQLKHTEEIKKKCEETVEFIKTQAHQTEQQIKDEFEKIHQFLRDEEEARLTALREEEEQKSRGMKEKLEEVNRRVSDLTHKVNDVEEQMKDSDVSLLENFQDLMEKAQTSETDPGVSSGALIDVARHVKNLNFRVWKKMEETVQYTPVTLDPNSAGPWLKLSPQLMSVRNTGERQTIPDNPERFNRYPCVLGSEGFDSGTHCWDVEVGGNTYWDVGITTESNERKGNVFFKNLLWRLGLKEDSYWTFSPEQDYKELICEKKLERVRVFLDYDGGKVLFSDPVTNKRLETFTTTFTETVFPFFYTFCKTVPLKILPVTISVTTEKLTLI